MPPQTPAPNKVLPDFPFPAVVVNTVGVDNSSRYAGNWTPIEPGTPFSPKLHSVADVAENQNKIFLQQIAGDGEFFKQVWADPPTTQDLYNYDISFSGEANDFPIFKRRYLELRDQYKARTKGSAFTGLFAVKITAGGAGYDGTTTVSISDTGGGTGATAIAIVDPRTGAVVKITLKSEGSEYGSGTITVTITGPGAGATASAVVQPSACVLVQEQVVQASSYWVSLYQMVERVYETLPGPWLYDWSITDDSEVSTVQRRHNLRSNITPGETAGGGFLIKTTGKSITDLVSWEIVETRPLPGNILTDYDTEPETQALITTTFQIQANPVTPPSPSPGQIITVKHIDDYNSMVIIQTRSTPAGWTEQRNAGFSFPATIDLSTYIYTDACGPISNRRAGFSCNVQLIVEISYGSYTAFTGLQLIPQTLDLGKYVQFTNVLVDAGFFVFTGSCTLTVSWPDSTPSYTAYQALIGTPQLIGGSSTKDKWGEFRTERLFVTML